MRNYINSSQALLPYYVIPDGGMNWGHWLVKPRGQAGQEAGTRGRFSQGFQPSWLVQNRIRNTVTETKKKYIIYIYSRNYIGKKVELYSLCIVFIHILHDAQNLVSGRWPQLPYYVMPDQAGQNALVFCSVYQFIVVCIRNTLINKKIHNIKKSVELYSWCISLHTGLAPCLKYYLWTRGPTRGYELCANTAPLLRYTRCYGAQGRRGHGLVRVPSTSLLRHTRWGHELGSWTGQAPGSSRTKGMFSRGFQPSWPVQETLWLIQSGGSVWSSFTH